MPKQEDVEGDGFISTAGSNKVPQVPIDQRCADCHQLIAPDGSGHRTWRPFFDRTDCPRLISRARHPATNIGE
jgi:hypothetical protein